MHVATADHVFSGDYNLPALADVEAFIMAERHLPGVPSAETMQSEGVDLNAMNAKLLEKVEELMLYTVEQDKRIAALEKKLK